MRVLRLCRMTDTLSATLPEDVERLIRRCLRGAADRKLTLTTAESCTGGLLSSVLTDIDGLGHVFDRGFVVYTDAAKRELLGVPAETLEREGAVSKPVAVAMAGGALDRSEGSVAIAVTGFAGPAGPGDEPGLVHFACGRRGGKIVHREEHFGPLERGPARIACLRVALAMLCEALDRP